MYHSVEHWTEYIDGLQNTWWSAREITCDTDVADDRGKRIVAWFWKEVIHWLIYLSIYWLIHWSELRHLLDWLTDQWMYWFTVSLIVDPLLCWFIYHCWNQLNLWPSNCDPWNQWPSLWNPGYWDNCIKVWFQLFISLWFQSLTWYFSVKIKDINVTFSQNVLYLMKDDFM